MRYCVVHVRERAVKRASHLDYEVLSKLSTHGSKRKQAQASAMRNIRRIAKATSVSRQTTLVATLWQTGATMVVNPARTRPRPVGAWRTCEGPTKRRTPAQRRSRAGARSSCLHCLYHPRHHHLRQLRLLLRELLAEKLVLILC